jgi:uncharacterized protein with GYD domain
MPLYMTLFAYTTDAWATLTHNPEDRSVAVRELLETHGGRLISWYLSFGEYDGVLIYEAPDDATAGALILAAARQGHLNGTKTTPPSIARKAWRSCVERAAWPFEHLGIKRVSPRRAQANSKSNPLT